MKINQFISGSRRCHIEGEVNQHRSDYSNKNTNACGLNGILKCWRGTWNLFGKNNERYVQKNTATGKSKADSEYLYSCTLKHIN